MPNRNRPYQALTQAALGGQTGIDQPRITTTIDRDKGIEERPSPLPYQQRMEHLVADLPQIGEPTGEMRQRAQDVADLQIDPQRRALEEMKGEARRRDLATAVERGVGRSGVVDWADQQRQKDFTRQVQDLERMRGQLTSQELSRLEEQAFQQGLTKLEALRQLSQDILQREDVHWDQAMQFIMFEADEALQWFDKLHLTPWQQAQLDTMWAEIVGEVPGEGEREES